MFHTTYAQSLFKFFSSLLYTEVILLKQTLFHHQCRVLDAIGSHMKAMCCQIQTLGLL